MIASFLAIMRHLPPLAQSNEAGDGVGSSATTIPLIELLPNIGLIIEQALEPFASSNAKEFGLFRWLQKQLKENTDRLAEKSRSTRPIPPTQFSGLPAENIAAYLRTLFLIPSFSNLVSLLLSPKNNASPATGLSPRPGAEKPRSFTQCS